MSGFSVWANRKAIEEDLENMTSVELTLFGNAFKELQGQSTITWYNCPEGRKNPAFPTYFIPIGNDANIQPILELMDTTFGLPATQIVEVTHLDGLAYNLERKVNESTGEVEIVIRKDEEGNDIQPIRNEQLYNQILRSDLPPGSQLGGYGKITIREPTVQE